MPWAIKDVDEHKQGLDDKQKEQWVAIANSAHQKCMDGGGEEKKCAMHAIMQANGVVGEPHKKMDNEEELFNINGVEIFRTGTWRGDKYTTADLQHMVDSFNEFKSAWFRPAIKDGHHTDKGKPALGYMENVRIQGEKLLADLVELPKKVYDAIKAKRYDRVSVEMYHNMQREGKTYPKVLTALAILGVEVPEVSGLKPLRECFEDQQGTWVAYELGEEFHLPGQHDQSTHGKGGGAASVPAAVVPASKLNSRQSRRAGVSGVHTLANKTGKVTEADIGEHVRKPMHKAGYKEFNEGEFRKQYKTATGDTAVDIVRINYKDGNGKFVEAKNISWVHALGHQGKQTIVKRGDKLADLSIYAGSAMFNWDEDLFYQEEDLNMKPEELEAVKKEYEAKMEAMNDQLNDLQGKLKEYEKKQTPAEVKTLVEQLSETQQKFSEMSAKLDDMQKKNLSLEEARRKDRIQQKVDSLKVPSFRFYAQHFYDWATADAEVKIVKYSVDGITKEATAEQIVDQFCAQLNKATDNLLIQHSKVDVFKRDDAPADDNPRVEADRRIKAYMAEHPDADYSTAMTKVFEADGDLKLAYARS